MTLFAPLIWAGLLLQVDRPQPFFAPVQPARPVQVMAHRGASGQAPENTRAAIERAIADGLEWVELDVRLSRDGRHVILHDPLLDRTTNGKGPVEDLDVATLKELDAGAWFAPRFAGERLLGLDDALRLCKNRINIYLDCKKIDSIRLARDVVEAEMSAQVVVFAAPEVLRQVRDSPSGDRLALMPKWRPAMGMDAFHDLRPAAVELDAWDLTPDIARDWHARGVLVQAKVLGTHDRPDVWDRAIQAGADWLQTDKADEIIARETLRRLGPRRRVRIAHHRGASRFAPENTLPAYAKSIALGADFVEFDIRTSAGNQHFLLHDTTLDRTTNGKGPIRELDSAAIFGLDAGAWFGAPFQNTRVPTLDAFLARMARETVLLYVDAKEIAPEALVAALRRHDLIDRAIVYQGADYLLKLREVEPRLRRMPPLKDPKDLNDLADRVAPFAFDTRWAIVTPDLVKRAHGLEIQVFSDALGGNETIDRYREVVRAGLDVIQTDHPLRVLRALELEVTPAERPQGPR